MKLEDLKQPYSESFFLKINKQLIDADFTSSKLEIKPDNSKLITQTKYYGAYDDLDIHIISVKHSGTEDARVGISRDIFRLMKKYSFQNALVAAYSNSSEGWRYSLVTSNLSIDDKGKITKQFSNPRRYSFLLGPDQKVLTPYKQLIQSGNVSSSVDLSKRFSLEVVNNEFYKEIAKLYDQLVGTDKIERLITYPNAGEESYEFAVRLIGRVIFCWFLREKRSKVGISLVPKEILSREASNKSNYYHDILAPLFFEVLNKPLIKRSEKFKTSPYADIPYLNGGLFGNDDIDHYKFDSLLELSAPGLVDIPDEWLRKLFDLLERFNFTVDENTSYDIDLSIDPEMLGRIFENLLARINPETGETVRKLTGSFYTPREIVEYMVDESIKEYLINSTSINKTKIVALTTYDLLDDEDYPLNKEEKQQVTDALSRIKVLDPACGSGAFPIGILQKIVFILQNVDPDAEIWFEKQISSASPEFRHHLEREFKNRNFNYLRKLGVIRESIYGVDIQPVATEISRLRCFLTLVVDQSVDDEIENRGIEPLPNLDFKFVTADSLVKLGKVNASRKDQTGLFEDRSGIDELRALRDEYFTSHNSERESLKTKFIQVQNRMLQKMLAHQTGNFADVTSKLAAWDPFSHNVTNWFDGEWMFGQTLGFDIVIANPPWVFTRLGNFTDQQKKLYNDSYIGASGKVNLYGLFIELGTHLTKENGIVSMIVPNTLLRGSVYERLRRHLLNNFRVIKIIDTGDDVFGNVTASTVVIFLQHTTPGDKASTYKLNASGEEFEPGHINIIDVAKSKSAILNTGVDESVLNLKAKIDNMSSPLDDYIDVLISGIQTWKQNKMNLISKEKLSDKYKPLIEGKDIERFGVNYANKYILYDKSVLNVMQDENIFLKPEKIVIQRVSGGKSPLKAAIDRGRYYCFNSLNTLICKNNANPFIAAVLNAKVTNWYYSNFFSNKSTVTVNISSKLLKQIPVPEITSNNLEVINDGVEKLIGLKPGEDDAEISFLKNKIDTLMYEAYGLTSVEIATIEGFLDGKQ